MFVALSMMGSIELYYDKEGYAKCIKPFAHLLCTYTQGSYMSKLCALCETL